MFPTGKQRIVIIGSYNRNLDGILALANELARQGHDVLYPRPGSEKSGEHEGFVRLDRDEHQDEGEQQRVVFRLIDTADAVIAYNPDRRLGSSAALEIGYSLKVGVPVYTTSIPTDITIRKLTKVLELKADDWNSSGPSLFDIFGQYSNRKTIQRWSAGEVFANDGEISILDSAETHTCRVFMSQSLAFKIRKSVDLGFLDYSTPEQRIKCALEEYQLGRRMSPDTYLGVWYYSNRTGQLGQFKTAGSEPVVVMRRLPTELRGDVVFKSRGRNSIPPERIDPVVRRLAEFHHASPADLDRVGWGRVDSIKQAWEVNFTQLPHPKDAPSIPLSVREWDHLQAETADWLKRITPILVDRVEEGRVRETHGDLRIDHVYLTELTVSVIDPLEFDLGLRFTDVAAEIGFLSMTLEHLGRPDVARRLEHVYADVTRDKTLGEILPFFKRYRAIVRMKIEWLRAMQLSPSERAEMLRSARRHSELALSYSR